MWILKTKSRNLENELSDIVVGTSIIYKIIITIIKNKFKVARNEIG